MLNESTAPQAAQPAQPAQPASRGRHAKPEPAPEPTTLSPPAVPSEPVTVGAPDGAVAEPAPKKRSRPHIYAFDGVRLIIMVFVVSVHTLSFAGGKVTMSIRVVDTIF